MGTNTCVATSTTRTPPSGPVTTAGPRAGPARGIAERSSPNRMRTLAHLRYRRRVLDGSVVADLPLVTRAPADGHPRLILSERLLT